MCLHRVSDAAWSCCLGMCDGVGECASWGADPRALLMLELLFGHVSVPTWGAECSAVLTVVCVPAWGEYLL